MNRFRHGPLLVGVVLSLTASAQTEFSIQPKTPAQQGNGWELPKLKLFDPLKSVQIRSATPRTGLRSKSTPLQANAPRACGHIIIVKPVNPGLDSRMVIRPPKHSSSMPMLEGLPACSEIENYLPK